MKQCLILFSILSVFLLGSCNKSADTVLDCAEFWENVSEAATIYFEDPTVENCNAYLDALKNYVRSDRCVADVWFEAQEQALADLEAESCE